MVKKLSLVLFLFTTLAAYNGSPAIETKSHFFVSDEDLKPPNVNDDSELNQNPNV
jgi:hypothetical protein